MGHVCFSPFVGACLFLYGEQNMVVHLASGYLFVHLTFVCAIVAGSPLCLLRLERLVLSLRSGVGPGYLRSGDFTLL